MAVRGTNTMSEGLQKLMQDITGLKATPDADVAFLIGLETTILGKLREGFAKAAGQMPPPPGSAVEAGVGGMGGMGAGGGMGDMAMAGAGGGGMPMPGGAPGGVPMGAAGPGSPMPPMPGVRFSPDVMRRAISGGGVQGG